MGAITGIRMKNPAHPGGFVKSEIIEPLGLYDTGDYSISDLSDVFKVSRPTIYRTLARQQSASGPSIKGKPAKHG